MAKVQIARVEKEPELILAYSGVSKVFKKKLEELEFDTTLYNWVVYQKHLFKYKELRDAAKYDYANVFPVLKRGLKQALKLPTIPKKIRSK